jgi:hypothetical protein
VQKQKQKQKTKIEKTPPCVESTGNVNIQTDDNYCAFLIFSIFGIECMVA